MLHFPSVSIRRSWPGRGTMVNDVNVPSRRKVSPPAFTVPLYCSTGTPQLPINSFAASESGGGAADNRDATKMIAKNVRIARVFMRDLTRRRPDFPAFNYGIFRPNPELYWEGGGKTPHSIVIMSGCCVSCKQAARCPPALTGKSASDNFAPL
jgi:hypothetical protein